MRPPSRLPGKTVCLSLCSRSANRARSRPCWPGRDAPHSSGRPVWRPFCRRSGTGRGGSSFPGGTMAAATHNLDELKRRMPGAIQVLKQELGGLRTGRASAGLVDHVQVEAYGSHMPLNQLATVTVPEPRLISVQVWDRSLVHAVEKGISAANLGLTPNTEGQTIRLRIPELNEERRKELAKVAHKYAENARVAVRHVRRDGLEVLKKMEKDHTISEDEHKRQGGLGGG